MGKQSPPFLEDGSLRLLLFGGKGGVGKTTLAAATALHWASQNAERKILVASTDPAHSLADSFDQPIGDVITPIARVSNLFALEIDAARRLEDFNRRYGDVLKTIADRGTYFDREDINEFFNLSLPGLDELMAVIEVAGIVKERRYGLVILDTAPTGHTLRLLALPQLMAQWLHVLDSMLAKHRFMVSTFRSYRPDETDAFLTSMAVDLRRLGDLLGNTTATEFVPVTIPEAMSIAETARLLEGLKSFKIRVRTLIVNRVMMPATNGCPFCKARHAGQQPSMKEIESHFSAWNLLVMPLFPYPVRGQETLRKTIRVMLGESPSPLPPPPILRSPQSYEGRGDMMQSLAQARLILFGGKGGVGKTTIAAATALHLARHGHGPELKKTLLFSTDPAHSLSDSLAQEIGNRITPVSGVEGLFALEMDSTELLEELKQTYMAEINEVFDAFLGSSFDAPFDRKVMEELITLTPPGMDELMALMKIMDFIDAGAFERYVLDLAPTGHALRFLEMPGLVRQWFIVFFKLLLKYQGVASLTRVAELLRDKSKQLRQVEHLLTNAERCQFVAVTIPEDMVVQETSRLCHRLAELSVACRWVVANMVVPASECAFCDTMHREQWPHLKQISALAPGLIQVPLFAYEVRGTAGLSEVAAKIYRGDGNG